MSQLRAVHRLPATCGPSWITELISRELGVAYHPSHVCRCCAIGPMSATAGRDVASRRCCATTSTGMPASMAAALSYSVQGGGAQVAFHIQAGNYDAATLIGCLASCAASRAQQATATCLHVRGLTVLCFNPSRPSPGHRWGWRLIGLSRMGRVGRRSRSSGPCWHRGSRRRHGCWAMGCRPGRR